MSKLLKNKIAITLLGSLVLFLMTANATYAFDLGGFSDFFGRIIFEICLTIGGFVLILGSAILDASIYWLIVQMGGYFAGSYGAFVALGWTVIRDLLNMLFIFSLIYIGIKTILNSEDSTTRRALGYLIAAALLINFSLFITQAVVDFTNILAVQVYNQILGSVSVDTWDSTPISEAFMENLGFSSWLDKDALNAFKDENFGVTFLFSLLILVFFSVAGIFLALGSIAVITRFVALALYMVFSPIMFVGWILPQFKDMTSNWLNGFFKQAFFAPLYLFMIYLSIQMSGRLAADVVETGKASFGTVLSEDSWSGDMSKLFMYFMVMIGFLWASLKVADKLSLSASNISMGAMGTAKGFVYRNSVGRGLNKLVKLDDSHGLLGNETVRRMTIKARDYSAGGTGYSDAKKMAEERSTRRARNDRISAISSNVAANIHTASGPQLVEMMQDKDTRADILKNLHRLNEGQVSAITGSDKLDDSIQGQVSAAAQKITNMKEANKEHLNLMGATELAKAERAVHLNTKQVDDLKLNKEQKDSVKKARESALAEVAGGKTHGGLSQADLLKKSAKDIAELPDKVFEQDDFVKKLDVSALKALERNQGKSAIAKNVRNVLLREASTNSDPANKDRLDAVSAWLKQNPAGSTFGV